MFRRVLALLPLVAIVALATVPFRASAVPPPTAEPYAPNASISEVGIRLAPPGIGDRPVLVADDAVRVAANTAGGPADLAKPYSVQLTRLTDNNYGPDQGSRVIENRLVWLVRFTGTPQPVYGPRMPNRVANELNVVVDAATGEVLESFSYR